MSFFCGLMNVVQWFENSRSLEYGQLRSMLGTEKKAAKQTPGLGQFNSPKEPIASHLGWEFIPSAPTTMSKTSVVLNLLILLNSIMTLPSSCQELWIVVVFLKCTFRWVSAPRPELLGLFGMCRQSALKHLVLMFLSFVYLVTNCVASLSFLVS